MGSLPDYLDLCSATINRCHLNKNKNYYVVDDAEFARPRNTLKIISNFF